MRLDVFLQKNGYYPSRNKAAEACQRGEVTVNGVVKNKPSYEVDGTETIVTSGVRYVSLGAYKMLRALDVFGYDCKDKVFADIGASTGGFTQCLLMGGAKKVYCVDVGKDLLDTSIACDERVVVMDETNARYLKKQDFADAIDAVTVDCSFISIKTLLPVLKEVAGENGDIIALIKPQFECGKKYLGKSGVLNDKKRLFEVIKDIYDFCLSCGFTVGDFTNSPKLERKNAEYLILLKQSGQNMSFDSVKHVVENSQRSD